MISSRRWISFRASAVDKPDGNLGKGDGVFIEMPDQNHCLYFKQY
jgi:hypothetical protein